MIFAVPSNNPDEIRTLGRAALERVANYYESLSDRPVLVPTTSAALRELVDESLPQEGTSFERHHLNIEVK